MNPKCESSLPIPGPAAPGEGEPIMCADGDESGMRRGGGRDRLCRLILGELCADNAEGDFLPSLEENVALDRSVPCSELVSRSLRACAPSPVAVSNSSSCSRPQSPTPSSHVQQASIVHFGRLSELF